MRLWPVLAVSLWSGLVAEGCNRPGCNGQDFKSNPKAPSITSMTLLEQFKTDPWTAVFAIDFTAPSQDLDQGQALIYLNGDTSPATLALDEALQSSQVPRAAPSGRFAVHLRFADTVQDGDTVRLGTQLQGAAGLVSNCYEMDLYFRIHPVAATALLLQKSVQWVSDAFDVVKQDLLKSPT